MKHKTAAQMIIEAHSECGRTGFYNWIIDNKESLLKLDGKQLQQANSKIAELQKELEITQEIAKDNLDHANIIRQEYAELQSEIKGHKKNIDKYINGLDDINFKYSELQKDKEELLQGIEHIKGICFEGTDIEETCIELLTKHKPQ